MAAAASRARSGAKASASGTITTYGRSTAKFVYGSMARKCPAATRSSRERVICAWSLRGRPSTSRPFASASCHEFATRFARFRRSGIDQKTAARRAELNRQGGLPPRFFTGRDSSRPSDRSLLIRFYWGVRLAREQVATPAPYEPKSTNLRVPASSRRWRIDGSPPWFDATPSHLAGETSSFVLRSSNPVKGRHDDFIWGIPKFSRCDQAARDQHDSP